MLLSAVFGSNIFLTSFFLSLGNLLNLIQVYYKGSCISKELTLRLKNESPLGQYINIRMFVLEGFVFYLL